MHIIRFRKERSYMYMFQIWKRNRRWPENYCIFNRKPATTGAGGRVEFPAKRFPKKRVFWLFRVNRIPSFCWFCYREQWESVNGMIFWSFRKGNSSQKNTNTVYSEYSYSGIVPIERAQSFKRFCAQHLLIQSIIIGFVDHFHKTWTEYPFQSYPIFYPSWLWNVWTLDLFNG